MAGTATRELPDTASGVLAFARGRRAAADRAEADLLQAAVQWAILHPAESLDAAESFRLRTGGECAVGLAGPGAPQVAEFCVAEFAAAVGLGSESGKYYLGHGLSLEAAGFVDTHVAPVAHRIKPGQLTRLVEEAIGRFMPDLAAQRRRDAADGRHFDIDHHQVSFAGTALIHGELDLGDALDLDDALRGIAAGLADLGCEESLDVRRSLAAGELARRQLALDLAQGTGGFEARSARTSTTGVRETVLHLHLSQAAIDSPAGHGIGRVENTRSPVTANQIREWCGHPDTHLTVKPVIDLEGPRLGRRLRGHRLCLPLVHPPRPPTRTRRPRLRLRPRPTLAQERRDPTDVHLPARTAVPTTPPAQDPRRLALHHPRPRHLPLVLTARLPVLARPPRHPRRQPRPQDP